MYSLVSHYVHIYELLRFLFPQYLAGVLDFAVLLLGPFRRHISENVSYGYGHAFIAHIKLISLRRIDYFDLYILFFQETLSELLSHLFSGHLHVHIFFCRFLIFGCLSVEILLLLALVSAAVHDKVKGAFSLGAGFLFLSRNYSLNYLFFYYLIGYIILFLKLSLFRYPHRGFHQISYHGIHVASYIAHFSKLGSFYFYKRRVHELCQSPGYLGLSASGRTHHQYILRSYLLPHLF